MGQICYVAGEMGIGNTCSASAVACFLLAEPAEKLTGVGTGIRTEQLIHKKQVIDQALALHAQYVGNDPFKALCAVGGLEIAAMTAGVYSLCAIGAADGGGWVYQYCFGIARSTFKSTGSRLDAFWASVG